MLDLFLFRHAKSSWSDETLDDFDRPLNKRGKKSAQVMGQYFVSQGVQPDMVVCSKAKRCKATLKLLLKQGFAPHSQVFQNQFYLATSDKLLQVIKNTPETVKSLMIIGHNPGLETLAIKLCKDINNPDYLSIRKKFPTAAFVHLKIELGATSRDCLNQGWSHLAPNSGTLYCYQTPKQLLGSG